MPYDMEKTGNSPMGDDMPDKMGGGEGATDQKAEPIHIASDMLPPGIKEGDCLHCTAMDENGCSFELEKGEGPDTGESWEDSFRKEMSASAPTQEAS